jgi:hypothetical protein
VKRSVPLRHYRWKSGRNRRHTRDRIQRGQHCKYDHQPRVGSGRPEIKPGEKLSASHALFWSTRGIAFSTPGKHTVNLEISWQSRGATVGKRASVDVFVDYPVSDKENEVIALMLNEEVGKYIALGEHAYHLKSAVKHIEAVMEIDKGPVSKALTNLYHRPTPSKK